MKTGLLLAKGKLNAFSDVTSHFPILGENAGRLFDSDPIVTNRVYTLDKKPTLR